jgi:hypothetical protein
MIAMMETVRAGSPRQGSRRVVVVRDATAKQLGHRIHVAQADAGQLEILKAGIRKLLC